VCNGTYSNNKESTFGRFDMKDVILIDGKNTAYRAHYTHSDLSSKGRPTSVIYGMLSMILNLTRKWPGTPIIVVWEGGRKTWRHDLLAARAERYKNQQFIEQDEKGEEIEATERRQEKISAGYKGTRDRKTDARKSINEQIPVLREILEMLDIKNVRVKNIEADDLIGILSHSLVDRFGYDQVIIYSTDMDFFQLVSKKVSVWRPAKGEKKPTLITNEWVKEEFGIEIKDWIKYRALVGDKSDNIPKVIAGIGPKKALKLLEAGLDPSQESFSNMPSKVKKQLEVWSLVWQDLHDNYKLCRIVRKLSNKNLSEEVKKNIEEVLSRLERTGIRRRKEKVESRKILEMLLDYDMNEIYTRKTELFGLK
jgi:DNA polymerase-1